MSEVTRRMLLCDWLVKSAGTHLSTRQDVVIRVCQTNPRLVSPPTDLVWHPTPLAYT